MKGTFKGGHQWAPLKACTLALTASQSFAYRQVFGRVLCFHTPGERSNACFDVLMKRESMNLVTEELSISRGIMKVAALLNCMSMSYAYCWEFGVLCDCAAAS